MKTLVTGVTGFAGTYLAEHLLAAGDTVLGCSRGGAWPQSTPPHVQSDVPVLTWDVGDPAQPSAKVLDQIRDFAPECIFHLAALSVPRECGRDTPTEIATAVNVDGTARVLDLAANLKTAPRVVFISSSHVYAPLAEQSPPLKEDAAIAPRGAYGKTKQSAEQLVIAAHANGLETITVRAFQHTGPRQGTQMMLPEWADQFARSQTDPINAYNCDTWIDLTDVRDVVRAYRLLAERGTPGETYNLGSGTTRRTGDILDILRTMAGPNRQIVELRPGVHFDPVADIERLVQATAWQADFTLEQTVADTWEYFKRLHDENTASGE